MIGELLIEQFRLHFADSLTDNIGTWRTMSSRGLKGVHVSTAELLMVGGQAVRMIKGLAARNLAVRGSVIFRSYSWYLAAIVLGFLHGHAAGGSTNIALWEIRTQVYGIIIHFLALNLMRTRAHFEALGWI